MKMIKTDKKMMGYGNENDGEEMKLQFSSVTFVTATNPRNFFKRNCSELWEIGRTGYISLFQ
jgi:hypothetical protein